MRKLAGLERAGWLLSFDFDGTMHHPADEPPVAPELWDLLERLRREHGALWVINTGRSMEHFIEGIEVAEVPFLPDFAVLRESEIFEPDAAGRWVGVEPWNRECEIRQEGFFRKAGPVLEELRHHIERETGAEWVRHDGEPAGLIAHSEEEMDWISGQLGELRATLPELGWQRNSIYLRFGHRDYHKGSALAELGRLCGVPAERRFAIGDGHNDLGMLDPEVAGAIACPANAVEEVKGNVSARGGYVASRPHSAGVVEALERVFG